MSTEREVDFGITSEREFVERLAGLGLVSGCEAEQVRHIRDIAQQLLINRAATPEAAGRGEPLENQVERLIEAINWACGCGDSDFNPYDGDSIKPRYFWRGELVKRAGLAWNREKLCYILPEPPSGEQAQPQTLWQRIEEVAENMKDTPDWKRGSAVNERSSEVKNGASPEVEGGA